MQIEDHLVHKVADIVIIASPNKEFPVVGKTLGSWLRLQGRIVSNFKENFH